MTTDLSTFFDSLFDKSDLTTLEAEVELRGQTYEVDALWNKQDNTYSCYDFWNVSRKIHEDFTLTNDEAEMINKELQEQS